MRVADDKMDNAVTIAASSPVSRLLPLAIKGLKSMYDENSGLFCYRLQKTESGPVHQGTSYRYTMMSLLGLIRARSAGLPSPIDIDASVGRLLNNASAWIDNVGDLGLLLWLCSDSSENHLGEFRRKFDLSSALASHPDGRRRQTMELSWFLTGLVHACKRNSQADLRPLADQTLQLVKANQGSHGLFGHMSRARSFAGLVRGQIGSFADQVYPILALAHYAHVFQDEAVKSKASLCANAICARQGSLGQWWWHYDSVTGRVVQRYPVYSVHQHAMGPMALIALEELFGDDFQGPINEGLKWINGANELGEDLEDAEMGVVWRCMQLPRTTSYAAAFSGLLGAEKTEGRLHTLYECRPYELGWLLYAFARSSRTETQE